MFMRIKIISIFTALVFLLSSFDVVLAAPGGDIKGKCADNEVQTAIGCISTDIGSGGIITSLLRLSVGIGGGMALLLMLYGTFIITTSAGIPDKLKAGKEIISSAIIGLIFIILSVVLMEIIGVSILGLPGL